MENKFSRGKIYKLINKNTFEPIYIGSTIEKLCTRIAHHRYDFKKVNSRKIYQYINTIGGFDNIDIVLIENYPCDNFEQLRKREQDYKELYNNKIYN